MEFQKIDSGTLNSDGTLIVDTKILRQLSQTAFTDMRYYFRAQHLAHWREIYESSKSSDSEKEKMLRNLTAAVEAKNKGVPYCQDTGTDNLYLFRGDQVVLIGTQTLEKSVNQGAKAARESNPFRNSVFVPDTQNIEKNSGDNSPAEIHHFHNAKPNELLGIFCNKGGGSGSKLWSFSEKPGLYQDQEALVKFLIEKIIAIGHSACPPYQLRIVLGGLSHLHNSEILTRSTIDDESFLSETIIQDTDIQQTITNVFRDSNMGAQGDGKFFIMPEGAKVYRAPRHAAHFFIGIGVACSAHRVQMFKITPEGIFLEKLEQNPERYLPTSIQNTKTPVSNIDLSNDREDFINQLKTLQPGQNFTVSGPILGARDKAHARWLAHYQKTGHIPDYLKQYQAVFYVGPSDTPEGGIIGSFGPTTATRMDDFAEFLLSNRLIPLSIAKGSRSKAFANNCHKYTGFFAAIQGGPASLLRNYVTSQKIIDFEDLGMEAVRLYHVKDMPVQMIVGDGGQDLYHDLSKTVKVI